MGRWSIYTAGLGAFKWRTGSRKKERGTSSSEPRGQLGSVQTLVFHFDAKEQQLKSENWGRGSSKNLEGMASGLPVISNFTGDDSRKTRRMGKLPRKGSRGKRLEQRNGARGRKGG